MIVPQQTSPSELPQSPVRRAAALSVLYDVVFVLNINSRGWILEKICKVIARQSGLQTRIIFTEKNNTVSGWLPPARSYFFSHFKIYLGALNSGVLPPECKKFVWFTHPDFSASNTAEMLVAALNRATTVFTANSFHERALQFLGIRPEKLTTILGGADPEQFKRTRRKGQVVGFVGAYYERKNPDLLLATVQAAPHIKFLLVAPHPSEVENKSLTWDNWGGFPELMACPNFEYVAARYEDFGPQYERMDVFLSLSKLEGGPIPLIEAMFANVYPVVTSTGFAEDIINNGTNGLLLPVATSVAQVVATLDRALADRSTDVAATVADLSWETFGDRFRDAIDPRISTGAIACFADEVVQLDHLREGWGDIDQAGVWLAMTSGSIRLRVEASAVSLGLSFFVEPAIGMEGVSLTISINGEIVDSGLFEAGSHTRELALPSKHAGGVMVIELRLQAELVEDLGTIRIEAAAPLPSEAVSVQTDASGLVRAKRNPDDAVGASRFNLPVIVIEPNERPRSGHFRRALRDQLGIATMTVEDGLMPADWDGVAIADGVPLDDLELLSKCDGYVARTIEDKAVAANRLDDKPVVFIPEAIRSGVPSRAWSPSASMTSATFFGCGLEAEQQSLAWITETLAANNITLVVDNQTLSGLRQSDRNVKSMATSFIKDSDLCFFSGSEAELPLISESLMLGVPVLIYGPSPLFPVLMSFDLQHVFVQNASRLAKTLIMLSRRGTRKAMVTQFQLCLESVRGLKATTDRYSDFAEGLVARREIARRRPTIATLAGEPHRGSNDLTIPALIRDLGCQFATFHATDSVPRADGSGISGGQHFAPAATAARRAFSTFLSEANPSAFLCPATSPYYASLAQDAGVPIIYFTDAEEEIVDSEYSSEGPTTTFRMPKIMPVQIGMETRDVLMRSPAEARTELGFQSTEIVVFCAVDLAKSSENEAVLEHAVDVAKGMKRSVRFVYPVGVLPENAAPPVSVDQPVGTEGVEFSAVDVDHVDLAMRAADLAMIMDSSVDETLFSRTMAHGLPVLARSDLVDGRLIGSRISGAIYDQGNHEDFRKNLKSLLSSAGLRQKLGAQARATFDGLPSYDEVRLDLAVAIARAVGDDIVSES